MNSHLHSLYLFNVLKEFAVVESNVKNQSEMSVDLMVSFYDFDCNKKMNRLYHDDVIDTLKLRS